MLAHALDHWLHRWTHEREESPMGVPPRAEDGVQPWVLNVLDTPQGRIRYHDSGPPAAFEAMPPSAWPTVVMVPDGPNVLEHLRPLIATLQTQVRVVAFDMPGFGFSMPSATYDHTLDAGAQAVLQVMNALQVGRATLAFSCANGLYALRVAVLAPHRVQALVLSQTPTLTAMLAWAKRNVPRFMTKPVVGQLGAWAFRRTAARKWYARALPKDTDAGPYLRWGMAALDCGACFSLAGVVQGLSRGAESALQGVTAPCTVLWGEADRSHRRTAPHSLLSLVPHAQWVSLPATGHFPDVEQPDRWRYWVWQAAGVGQEGSCDLTQPMGLS